jgi:NAD(P)-dependent dehydrogenase (short-subunit alcohol dehydrogenase family)
MGKSLAVDFPETCALIECDVRQIWLCQSSIAEAEERFGRIDVVINTASKSIPPLHEHFSMSEWRADGSVCGCC